LLLLHELGHEVDYDLGASIKADFRKAVRADFAHLPRAQRRHLAFYRNPSVAFAEFFAERYAPDRLYRREGAPDINRLKRTHRLVNNILDRVERCDMDSFD
jgi:hypothetical protein